uniref:Uncharacterized protein n=1 Tax=Solanum tuberosum TaxID=4113 RepID=M1A8V3_SOLTU
MRSQFANAPSDPKLRSLMVLVDFMGPGVAFKHGDLCEKPGTLPILLVTVASLLIEDMGR